MGAIDFSLDGFIPDSLFVNDAAIASANAAAMTSTAQIQSDAALQATMYNTDAQTELITTISLIVGILLLVFAILWFFK